MSPSSRRAWIEISSREQPSTTAPVALLAEGVDRNVVPVQNGVDSAVSPSSRRAWIEMICAVTVPSLFSKSPSSRRAWIEIVRAVRLR